MPSVRDLLRGGSQKQSAPSLQIDEAPVSPQVSVGEGHQTGRFARMVNGVRQAAQNLGRQAGREVRQAVNHAEQMADRAGRVAGRVAGQVSDQASAIVQGAAEKVERAAQKAVDAKKAAGRFVTKTALPGLEMLGKMGGGLLVSPAAGYLERKNQQREERAENRFKVENADMIAALSRQPKDSIADRPGVRELLAQDIQRNAHGTPRMTVDEAVHMARIGQHIAQALADGATLNENGNLPVEVDGQTYEVKPGSFASRALAWHMTAAAANSTLLRQELNPGQDVSSDVTNSGTFVMKDPGGRIYAFLNANPQVQGRVSTHFEDRIDNDNKILLGKKAVQRGYDDYLGKLPGQGGALLFDKMKNGELFIKVEHAGCPGAFAREGHHNWKDIAVRAPLALNKWYEHAKSLKKSMAEGQKPNAAPNPGKIVRQEHIDKGKLRGQISEPLQDALAMAAAAGAITPKEAEKLYDGARKQGLKQVEKVTNYLRGMAGGIQSPGMRNLLNDKLDELSGNIQNVRQEFDALKQHRGLGVSDIDRRGAEVHVSLDPAQNPAFLHDPGHQAPNEPAPNVPPPAPGDLQPAVQQPAVQQPAVAAVAKLTGGLKGEVFKVDFNDGSSQVIKLQNESPVAAIAGTKIVQEAGVLAPNIVDLGGPGALPRAEMAAMVGRCNGPAAAELARQLRGNKFPQAVNMEFAPGLDLGKRMKEADFKQNVLLSPRFQDQLGRLFAADAVAGNPDRMYAARTPDQGLMGFYNKGNLKIHGQGDALELIAIDNEFNPGAQFLGGIEGISDEDLHGLHAGVRQVGSKAAASPLHASHEIGLVVDQMCKDAGVQLAPEEREKFIANVQKANAAAIARLLAPAQGRRQQLQDIGVNQKDLDDFARHKRGLRMLGKNAPAAGGHDLSVGEKLKMAAGSDKNHRQGYRAYMGKEAVAGDLPERAADAVVKRGRNRGGPQV